jgi:hypothetical protein
LRRRLTVVITPAGKKVTEMEEPEWVVAAPQSTGVVRIRIGCQ